MKRTPSINPRALAAAFILFAVAIPHVGNAQSPSAASAYPRRWEYKVVLLGSIDGTSQQYGSIQNGDAFTKSFADGLTKFGSEGWELVCVDTLQGNKVAIFKRPNTAFAR